MSFASLLTDTMDILRRSGDLVTNGGFADGTGWTPGTGWAIASGSASYIGASGAGTLTQAITPEAGTKYRIKFDVTIDGGSPSLGVTFGGKEFSAADAAGAYVDEAYATDASGLVFTGDGVGANDISIDNVELFEIDSMGAIVETYSVEYDEIACRLDERRGRELVDGEYTEVMKSTVFTELRDVLHDDIIRITKRSGVDVDNFDLAVDSVPEFHDGSKFHHLEIGVIKAVN